jgi:aminocarboxymuconate-semialdehyde decarboxylase
MINRRSFLKDAAGAAGIAFTSCALLDSARAQQTGPARRREVTVGGRRVKTIDVHAHTSVPEARALMGSKPTAQESMAALSTDDRLRAMDQQGIDMEAISINPFWYGAQRDVAARIIQLQNQKLAELCKSHPDRFVAYATVALQYPDLAAQQLEDGVKKLGLRGGSIGAIVNGEELSARKFDPFWAKAEELGVLLFMHPAGTPDLQKRLQGNGLLTNVIGNPLDTTIALSHLIFDGTLDRFPRLKLCAAHGGGYLPSYADRSDHGCLTFPEACKPFTPLKKKPTEYLRQLYFDSLVFTPEALRHLVAQCGVSQIMIGTDFPYPWTATAVDHIMETPGLSAAEREAILGGNAAKLLRIPT